MSSSTTQLTGATILLALFTASVSAQSYPAKPLRMLVPAGPGGGVDTIARMVGTSLASVLGQPVVMENRPGAGTMIASDTLAKSPPDGYTLLMVTNSHVINAGIHPNLPYNPIDDFSPITLVASVPYQVVVHPSVPATTVNELASGHGRRAACLQPRHSDRGRLDRVSGPGEGVRRSGERLASVRHR